MVIRVDSVLCVALHMCDISYASVRNVWQFICVAYWGSFIHMCCLVGLFHSCVTLHCLCGMCGISYVPPLETLSYVLPLGTPSYVLPLGTPSYVLPLGTPSYVLPFGTPSYVLPLGTPSYVLPLGTPSYVLPLGTPSHVLPLETPSSIRSVLHFRVIVLHVWNDSVYPVHIFKSTRLEWLLKSISDFYTCGMTYETLPLSIWGGVDL